MIYGEELSPFSDMIGDALLKETAKECKNGKKRQKLPHKA